MSASGSDTDVLVAGAGRAGTIAALDAVRRGRSVVVLEKRPAVGAAVERLRDRGITVLGESRAMRLIVDAGRVTGIRLTDERAFAAHSVVIATGGYESDPELTRRFEDVPDLVSAYGPEATGDGLRMGAAVGARIQLLRNNLAIALGYRSHGGGDFTSATPLLMRPHALVVNRFGRRVANEADPRELAPALRAFDAPSRTYTNVPCWLVFDARFGAVPADAAAVPVGFTPIDAEALAATLGPRAVPPFFAIALRPAIRASAGLLADRDGRVLNWRGTVIPGLSAAGRVAAR